MALFIREIKGNLRSFVIWTVVIIALTALLMAMYPSFAQQGDELAHMLAGFPPEMTELFGLDALDFTQVINYYAYIFQYLMLAVMIQFMLLGTNLISREEDAGTINFLYAKPISRRAIVGVKALAGLTIIAAFFIINTAATGVILSAVGNTGYDFLSLLIFGAALALSQAMMLGIGIFLSMFITKARPVMSASIGVVLLLYVAKLVLNISESAGALKYFTPFEYFDARALLNNGIEPISILLAAGVGILGLIVSLLIYNRKDLKC